MKTVCTIFFLLFLFFGVAVGLLARTFLRRVWCWRQLPPLSATHKKVIVLTGASHGIGKALKSHLEAQFPHFCVVGVSRSRQHGGIDVSKAADVTLLARLVAKRYGPHCVAAVVNNAGVVTRCKTDSTAACYGGLSDALATNTVGPFGLVHALNNERCLAKEGGLILNISSTNAKVNPLACKSPSSVPDAYSISKAALNCATRVLAVQFPKWRAMAVHPGLVRTRVHRPTDRRHMLTAQECAEDLCRTFFANDATDVDKQTETGSFVDRFGKKISLE